MLIALLFLLLLTILGTSSLNLAFTEIVLSKSIESDAKAFYAAESGIAQALYWLNNPDKFVATPENFFFKRQMDNTSFFDETGKSQFGGTPESPDLIYSTAEDVLMIYGPSTPGALCTVASRGISGRISRIVTAELFEDISGVRIFNGSWRTD